MFCRFYDGGRMEFSGWLLYFPWSPFIEKKKKIYAYRMPITSRNSAKDLIQRARELPLCKENTQSSRKIFLNEYILFFLIF